MWNGTIRGYMTSWTSDATKTDGFNVQRSHKDEDNHFLATANHIVYRRRVRRSGVAGADGVVALVTVNGAGHYMSALADAPLMLGALRGVCRCVEAKRS